MNKTLLKIVVLIIGFLCTKSFGQNLKSHQWKNRILIIKAPNIKSEKYVSQMKQFTNANDELKERKIVIYKIIGNEYESITFDNEKKTSGIVLKPVIENTLNKKEKFEIVLIGLDGQKKLQKNDVLAEQDLYAIIDSMPMRKQEIKN